jgi:hypothetical protein
VTDDQDVSDNLEDLDDSEGFGEETTEALLEQAQQNAQAMILGTISLLHDLGVVPEAWADGLGERFSAAWGDEEPWEAGEFLDAMLSNYRALGAEIVASEMGAERATATLEGFPDEELCEVFMVDPADAHVFHRVAAEIARRRGLTWTWEVDEGVVTLMVDALGDGTFDDEDDGA